MCMTKKQEENFCKRVDSVVKVLEDMDGDESADFVLNTASKKTLKSLNKLQLEIVNWNFLR